MSERLKEAHELNRNNQILLGQQQKLLQQFEQPVAPDLDVVDKKTEMGSDKISFFAWLKKKFNV
jgi:hypothetical protein